MKKFLLLALSFPLAVRAQEPSPVPSPAPSPIAEMDSRDRLEALDAAQIKLATETIRSNHVEATALDETGLARATLRGLLDGLQPGAELTGGEAPKPVDAPFRSEVLDGRVGYLRLGTLGTESLAQLDEALKGFAAKKTDSVVIDLRATPESSDFPMAAQFAERFVPNGTALFSLARPAEKQQKTFTSTRPPAFQGVLAVLVDGDTAGAAEVLAAALRRHAKAMIVGTASSGRAVEYADLPLGSDHHLRYAVAEARVADLPPIYPRGIEPDLEVPQSEEDKKSILDGALEKGIAGFVFETERARMNEASLVAGTNPEIDAGQSGAVLLDRPLQRAVDLVTAIKLFRKRG